MTTTTRCRFCHASRVELELQAPCDCTPAELAELEALEAVDLAQGQVYCSSQTADWSRCENKATRLDANRKPVCGLHGRMSDKAAALRPDPAQEAAKVCTTRQVNGLTCRRPAVQVVDGRGFCGRHLELGLELQAETAAAAAPVVELAADDPWLGMPLEPLEAPARRLDAPEDTCPKLAGGLGGTHYVKGERTWTGQDGQERARCRYCSRTIGLTPVVDEVLETVQELQAAGLAQGQLELELPEPRSCASCGGSLEGLRPQATTCSARCRQAAARARRPAAPAKELGACRYCHRPLTSSRQATCSTRCRSAMHRRRSSALDTTLSTRLSPVDLFRLQAAHGPEAPEAMRVAGSSFWLCRCGLVVRQASTSCGFCGGLRPAMLLIETL